MKGLAVFTSALALALAFLKAANGDSSLPLYPSPKRLNLGRFFVSASSTCSEGEAFMGQPCDSKFGPRKAVDSSKRTAWVSQRLNSQRVNVTFTVDMKQLYHLSEMTLFTGRTPHSMSWEIQASEDGQHFRTLVYFVPGRTNCPPETHYARDIGGLAGTVEDGVPICSDEPRHLLEEGQLMANTPYKVPLMTPYQGGADLAGSPTLLTFLKTRYIRFLFKAADPPEIKVTPTRIFSIAQLRVSAICSCNGFASECLQDPVTKEYVCQCQANTCGNDCSSCCPEFSSFQFKSFDSGNGTGCTECDCNGHSTSCRFDLDRGSSVCVNCENGTAGPHCEVCADGYYRTSPTAPCQECNCVADNSINGTCDDAGQCRCLPGYSGLKCTSCGDGKVYNTFTEKCEDCPCDPRGTRRCRRGRCVCARGFMGELCDRCEDGYYGYPNCRDCACPSDPMTLILGVCDAVTGQCPCPSNRSGKRCESCDVGYYGTNRLQPCQSCDCHVNGSLLSMCNEVTGKCICKLGYKGVKCDENSDEYFGFPDANPCNCDIRGSEDNVCDKTTGECTCRTGAVGRECDQCEDGTYPSLQGGCAACECDPLGAVSLNCTINGRCICKEGVGGQDCESCRPGYWNFGENGCTPCNCTLTGTDPRQICDTLSGDCVCVAEHMGENCGECNTTRLHISTDDGCEICGDCVDPLVNTTNIIINLLNKTIELLPNLTIRIGPFDLVYIEKNASFFASFLEIWARDVQSIEAALGLREDLPPIPGSFVLDIRPPLLPKHDVLRDLMNRSTEFSSLDVFGERVAVATGRTFSFSSELDSSFAALRITVEELAQFLEELEGNLEENFERVRSKRIRAEEVNNIVVNRDFTRTDEIVEENLDRAKRYFSDSARFEATMQRIFNLAVAEVMRFNSSGVEGQLDLAYQWLVTTNQRVEEAEREYTTAFELKDAVDDLLPRANDLSTQVNSALTVLTEAVESNEEVLVESQATFEEANENFETASVWFVRLNASTSSFEERLYAVIPEPNDDLVAELHAMDLFANGSRINASSHSLRLEARAFLDSLPPVPVVEFERIENILQIALQQSSSADALLKDVNLADLLEQVRVANKTSYHLLEEAREYEENSTVVKSLVDDVETRYLLAENWTAWLEDRLDVVMSGLKELEQKPDFSKNFEEIRRTADASNATFRAVNSTLDSIEEASPSVQDDIDVSRNNTEIIHENMNISRFLLDCVDGQAKATRSVMASVDGAIDTLMETNDEIISEIDDIITGLKSVHNVIQKVNAPAIFERSVNDPRPFLSLQPPDRAQAMEPVLFDLIDLYLVPNGLSEEGSLLFYAGPAWRKDDVNHTRQMNEETFIALTASKSRLTLHYNLKVCQPNEECTSTGDRMLDHKKGQLLDVSPNHVQIMRVGNHVRLVRRSGGENGEPQLSTPLEQEGELLFIPTQRTVYYIGGQPSNVKIHASVDGYESYSGNVNLLLYNHKEWSIWDIRDSSPTKFWDYSNNRKKGNTLVFTDLSESELLSFDGNGYLYTQQLAGGVNTKIRSESIGVDSELVFSFSAQSRDGLIVFMFEPSEQMSLELSLTNGIVMLQIRDRNEGKNETLYFLLHAEQFELAIKQFYYPSLGIILFVEERGVSPRVIFSFQNYFRETTDTQVWFGGYREDIADSLRRRNNEELYEPVVTSSFRGSVKVEMQGPNQAATQDVFTTSFRTFREHYINSEFQRGVSRTAIKTQYVDLIGFTGQSFLMYNDTMLRGLINIQEYRPSKLVDSYALQFRTDRPEGGVLFHATSGTSGLLLFIENMYIRVELKHNANTLTMSTRTPVVEANRWHSVLIRVSFQPMQPMFKLFVDNKMESEISGLRNYKIHKSDVNFDIEHLSLAGSLNSEIGNFVGCIRNFIVQENPFNVLADNLEPFSSQDFDEISRRVSDREGITFYQCPNLRKPDPVVTYPVLPQVVEVYCVPAEDVELAEFSLGGFRRSTTLKTSNTVPLLERNFVITFNVIFYDDREIHDINTNSSNQYHHVFSLSSKYDEMVSLVLDSNRNVVMVTRSGDAVMETLLLANSTQNLTLELSCSGLNEVFSCSLNGMPPVVVARRNYFYPKWPLVFGRATGMENAMEKPMDSFVGCMGNFAISDLPYTNIHTGQPCFDDAIPGYYFNGIAHVAVPNISVEVSFSFKPVRTNGLLAAILEKTGETSFTVKVAIGYKGGQLSASNRSQTDAFPLEGQSPGTSGCGLPSNLTLTPYEGMLGIVYCEGSVCHSEVALEVPVGPNDQLYIGGVPRDVEYSEVDVFLFLKPSDVSEESLPPFFVGTVYPPLPADSDLQLNNISPGLAP